MAIGKWLVDVELFKIAFVNFMNRLVKLFYYEDKMSKIDLQSRY